ncbi:plectin isoform X5 [Astyanax mexicanus]|uniref:plectin isoform X5 n=1 Tax=Astyanax mexicanus TaxID=7994 RepID=UPI0020CAFB03|nr:plectin isoform X5 [Astyanax mexicanus]
MVAGMVMPLNHLRAIYERLFRDGVMVAKKDKRPQTKHPEIQGVGNLQVIRAMGSLKSRGFVRETFTWRHFYWYLTNEGIVYLRDYLHLPPEIVPTPLQRVRKPAATLAVAQRDTRVQAIEGPTSYVPKPGRGGAESQEAFLQRQEYRRREMTTKEEQVFSDKTPRFRGRPIAGDQIKPNAPFRDQVQPYSRSGQGYAKEVDQRKTTPVVSSQLLPAESTSAQSLKWKTTKAEFNKGTSEAALIKKSPYTKTMAEVELAPKSAVTSLAAGTVAASMSHKKPKEEISVQISRETITSNPAQHVTPPPFSEKQVAKTMKATEAKNVHDHSVKDEMTKVTEKMSVTQTMTSEEYSTRNEIALKKTSPKAPVTVDLPAHPAVSATKAETVPVMASMPPNKSSKEKFKDKVSINIFQETNKKQANNATQPPLSQKKVETIVKASVTENVLEHPVKEVTGVTEQVSTLAIEKNVTEICRSGDKTSLIESLPSATISMDPPTQPAVNVATGDTIAVTTNKTHKEKKKDKKSQMLQELSTREEANDATQCLSSKKKQGKKVKATVTELVQEPAVSDEVPTVIESVSVVVTQEKTKSEDYSKSGEEISIQCLANTTASENLPAQVSFKMENPDASVTQVSSDKTSKKTVTEEVSVIISQETKDASLPASAKKKAGKKQKAAAKSGQDDPMKDKAPKMTEEDSLSATQILTTENYTSNDAIALDERLPKTAVTVDLQAQISTTTVDVVAVMPSESSSKSAKEKLGESVSEEKPQETSMSKEQVQDGSIFSSSKKKRDKKQKSTKLDLDNSENVKKMTDQKSLPKTAATDDLLTQLPAATKETVAATTSVCSNKTDKEKLEVSIKVSQDANTREQADDATQSPASKKEVEKKLKGSVSLMSPDESRKMTLKEEISVNNSQETKDEILGEVSMTATQNMISENYTSTNMTALIDSAPKTVTVNVDLPVISSGSSSNAEEKKLEVSVEQQQETSVNKDKAQDASLPSSSKKKREKKQKAAIIKNVHPVEDEVPDVAEKVSVSLMSDQESLSKTGDLLTKLPATTTETVAATAFNKTDKEKLEVSAHDSQDANAREQANNAIQSSLLKKEVKQTVKSSLTENVQQNTISEKTIKVTEKISMLVTQEKTSSKDSSESGCEKVIVELPAQVVTTTENTVVSMTSDKSSKKMLNQEAPIIISQEKEDVSLSASSKKKAGKKQKAVATKSVHNDPVKDGAPKVIEEVSMSTTQMLTTENYTSSDATASTGDLLTKHSATTTETVAAIAHECTNKTDKEKLEATINVSEDVNTKEQAGDTTLSSSLKKDAEKTVEPVTENVQEKTRSEDSSEIEENVLIKSLPKTKASEEEVSVIIPQEAKDASLPASTKKKAGKKQKGAAAKSVQADPMKDEAPKRTEEVSLSATQMKIPSEDLPNTEGLQKTVIITLDLPTQISPTTADIVAVLPSEHSSKFNEEKLEEAASVETPQEISASKEQAQDSSVPSSSKKKREKKPKASITKNIHTVEDEIPEVAEKVSVSLTSESAVQPEDLCLDLEKTENTKEVKDQDQHLRSSGSAVPPVAQKEKDTALLDVNLDADKDEANIAQRTTATVVATVPSAVTSSNAQKSKKKKAKKTSSIEETKDSDVASEKSEQTSLNAAKDVEIPVAETSTTKVKTEIKTLDHDPIPATEIPAAATVADAQAKEIFIHKEIQIVKQIITVEKEISKQVITSTQEKQQSSKPVEDSEAKSSKKQETEQTLKARKKGKKTTAALNKDLSPAAEIKTAEVMTAQVPNKDPPSQGPETPVTNSSTKMAPERMCTKDGSEAAAVETVEAPAYKGEVESAQPSAEKIKREVLKGKTSSSESAREAPTGRASAAASAQAGPHPEQGDPPSVAQYSAAPDTQHGGEKQKELSESEATELHTVHTGPLPTEEIICDTQALPRDEAAMRRKIVVVEEVIEVQQIASPGADGSPPVQPPVPVTGEELDYDVLEELAQERVILQGSPIQELIWDHSLDEPEAKTFPNFIEDERDRVQKKTFTKWVNKHLIKHWRAEAQRHVSDLYEDLRDGHNLISLLEVLSGETLPREKGRMRFHKLQNVQIALDFLRHRQVKLVNIRNDDIADGNPKLTLGLIWTIILHFQVSCSISDIQVNGQSDDMSAKEKLLLWSQRMVEGYQGMRCDNFTTSWRDGKLFNAVIHRHEPRLVDMSKVYRQTNLQNLEQAFNVAEKELGVTRLLDPEDVDVPHPDEKSIITYVSSLYDAMPRETVSGGVRVSELELRWQEYYELVTILLQWIRHHVIIFEERKFPASFEEIEILWRQFLKFKETELPAKEADKDRSKLVYQSFESAVQAGQIKVPPGYHPIDVEKEWGRLHVAILERERLLRTEFERLERLQRIVSKVQMESGVCEEQLNHLETLLQSDIRLLSAGKPAQYTAEVGRDLDKADDMIRLLFNDVQILKDGRHLQAEQMYRRVYRLHERLVNLRSDYNLRMKSAVVVPPLTSSPSPRARPELDDVTLRYAQDLLAWVEENQRRIETAEWGSDLPTVESQLGSHRGLHQTVEDFKSKIERARADENQLSPMSKSTYREYLAKLDLQYAKLLNSSKSRLRNLDQLHAFVNAATKELIWLNDKEEEEVNFDWSDRNTNMTAKKENYSGLMRELELREKKVNEIQATGDRLIREGHPGKKTVEAFTAGLQTQWSWILQLCCCIEAHLKENTAYYQFFADVKEADEKMKKMQDTMKKKYTCDRSTTSTRLEDLVKDALDEKEQLNEFKTQLAGLNKRARSIIQLKPRNPTNPIKGKQPVQAVCDFKQMEITVHKGEECALLNNSQPSNWKVLNRSGAEAIVPSVCFLVPPVNKEAVESVSNLDAGLQQMTTLWQRLHIDMKSLLSWQYLMKDIQIIRSWNITMLKTMKVDEYRQILRNLELHYQDYLRDSQNSQFFKPDDRLQTEKDYKATTQHYENLLQAMQKGDQDESVCKTYITQLKDLRLQIEDCESRTVARIRQPVEKDPLKDCITKATDQRKVHVELGSIKKNLDKVAEKTEQVLASPEQASTPVLRSELDITLQKMDHTYNLSSVYLEKLKTIEMVIRNTNGAENILKKYEDRLREVYKVPTDTKEVESYRTELKKMRSEAEEQQPLFVSLDGDVAKAAAVSERMTQVHRERDTEMDHYKQLLANLQERWRAMFAQIDLRQRELDQLGRQLGYYRNSYDWLIRWIADAKEEQEKIHAVPITDSKSLKEQLAKEKKLLEEIEKNKEKVDECQKYAKAYIDTIKDYELQLVAYKAQVEPLTSPLKKTKMESASDNIIQEYVTLRTRYSELMTLTSQYIKFITDTQSRLEDEEMATAQQEQINQEKTILQQTFISEKEQLLKREKQIEDEKKKLENQYEDEVKKSKALKEEQERQQKQMEEEKKKLKATMDAALQKQKEAEQEMLNKQKAMQELEKKKLEQERMLAEENQKLREKLQQLEVSQKPPPLSQEIQTSDINGSTVTVDGRNGDSTLCFDGIREKVPASRLLEVGLLSKTDYDKLMKGKITVNELSKREDLKTALKGKNSIGGLLVHPNQKMSIYQAMKAQKILAGTGLQLLEAQAASGFLVDPIKNKKLTVTEAVKEGLIGPEYHNKMLSAEKAVTGYEDPYTGAKISLFENMKKGLIVKDHAIRLLEAQIATGGIIDAINSHRVSTEIAYKQGQFDEEMNQILQDPTDDTKAFFDPNTQENLTYLQLMERCIIDPETGLLLLPINEKAQNARTFTDEETRDVFKKTTVLMPFGRFQGKTVTIWEIINSEYFTEDQRKDLIRQYKTGKITVEKIIKIIITVAEEKEKKKELEFDGLRAPVPATELLDSKIIDKDLYNKLHQGKKTVQEVSEMETVHKALKGSNCIAGVVIDSTKETMSFYQAIKNDVMRPEPALALIEAQAASGYIVDPVKNQKFTVDEAVKAGAVGPELHEKLLSAERAVTGYRDPYTGQTVSLFEAMKKELIGKDQGIRFLDAQLATGGIIDPVKSHRIPHDIACKRGYFDDETNKLLSNPTDEIKSFYDPNTQEYVTYLQLQKRCITDKKTGLQLLSLSEEAIKAKDVQKYNEAQTKEAMTQATVELESGPFKGRKVTIWEIINSDYLTEEQRLDLIRQYRSGKVTIEKIIKIVITIVDDKESKKQDQSSFQGLRTRVPAKSLFDSKIIDKATYDSLQQGKTTPNDVSKNNSVNKYLQGSESIAGIFLEPTKEKVSIYQAMKKKLLRQNTGISLLEAQVATGFIVDPVKKQFLTVDDAVKAGLVGPELHEKLLTAEKAVTGYKDPFTGHNISLFQAMQKELIPKEHAMPLLEAQISTGGIIDPVNSHRIPTDVAYQKGYFSKEMSSSIAETANVNKTFSDPETDENVSYKQLKDKCMTDPETGLCLLPLSKPQAPTVVEKTYLYTEEQTQSDLSSTQIDLPIEGLTQGSMSLWDVMNSSLLPEEERTKLLEEYRSGKITKERMIIIIIEIMEQREIIRGENVNSCNLVRRRVTIEELYNARIIDLETFNLLKQEKKTIREIMELQGVKQYLFGTGSVAGVLTDASTRTSVYQAMKRGLMKPENAIGLLEAQAATGFIIDPMKNEMLTVDEAVRKGVVGPEIHDKLLSAERAVTGYKDPYSGKIISLFQAMKKGLVPEDYALRLLEAQTSTGGIIDPEFHFHLPADIATQRGYINRETYEKLSDEVKGYADPLTEESISYAHMLKRCKVGKDGLFLLSLSDQKQMVKGLRKLVTIEELIRSEIIDAKTASDLNEGLITIEELSERLKKYLEGTSCISGVYVESTKDCLSIYQAMKKNMIRPGTAFELLEAQAATGYIIDPIKNLKLTVSEAVKMGIVGPEFRDKLLSAERAVTGYRDPYTGKTISLFQAMKKGLILKDHGIRLLEAQIATGGIIDPEESHRLPVEVAYNRGLFDEDMNEILSDPSDDTKGFFDPNTEENLTYLQLMERCITDPQTGLVLLLLKEKKRERKTSSKSSVRKRRVVIVDPESGKEMSVYEAYRKGLIDHKTYLELAEQECEWEEITMTSSDGEEKSIIIDRRSGRQYDIADALARGLIDQSALDQYRSGNLAITEFADMLSGNMSGFRSRSSSFGSTSSYPMSPVPSIRTPATVWNDPTEETGPVAGILDTDTLEKVSVTEAMHRNLVDNITGQRLLEAQACTGGIIDLSTGEKLPVADALSRGLVDKIMVERINLAQKAFNGFEDPRTKAKMSAAQALKKGWLYYEAGQRFLEVQYLTGGLIEPETEGRVSLEEAIKRSLIDARTAQKLRDVSAYSKYLTCPKTKLKISYKDAMDRSMVEEGTGLRLLEACSSSSKGLYSPYNVSGAGSATGSRSGSRTGSRSGSRRGSFDATGSGFSMNFSSSSYSSTSYSRRY